MSLSCSVASGGGLAQSSVIVDVSRRPLYLSGVRFSGRTDGAWTSLYDVEASRPACFVMTDTRQWRTHSRDIIYTYSVARQDAQAQTRSSPIPCRRLRSSSPLVCCAWRSLRPRQACRHPLCSRVYVVVLTGRGLSRAGLTVAVLLSEANAPGTSHVITCLGEKCRSPSEVE